MENTKNNFVLISPYLTFDITDVMQYKNVNLAVYRMLPRNPSSKQVLPGFALRETNSSVLEKPYVF